MLPATVYRTRNVQVPHYLWMYLFNQQNDLFLCPHSEWAGLKPDIDDLHLTMLLIDHELIYFKKHFKM